MRGCNKN
jgi:hypothetical protein